jgi:MOSC domain-containing protein YiiM
MESIGCGQEGLGEMTISRLIEVRTGKAVSFGNGKVASAINKIPREGPVLVRRLGLEGDEQADHRFHGGSDKAVLHYAADNYDVWRSEDPEFQELFVRGAFGENFVSHGLDETNVCLGDVFRIGDAEVEVSQPRQPCFKLNLRFHQADMSRRVQTTGRTGWYYRVLSEGEVAAGDAIALVDRPYADWTLRRVQHHLYVKTQDQAAIERLAQLPVLSESMRKLFEMRIASKATEQWDARLTGAGVTDPGEDV